MKRRRLSDLVDPYAVRLYQQLFLPFSLLLFISPPSPSSIGLSSCMHLARGANARACLRFVDGRLTRKTIACMKIARLWCKEKTWTRSVFLIQRACCVRPRCNGQQPSHHVFASVSRGSVLSADQKSPSKMAQAKKNMLKIYFIHRCLP